MDNLPGISSFNCGTIAGDMTPRQDPCQESSSVRPEGQRLEGELHRHLQSYVSLQGSQPSASKTTPALFRDGMRLCPGLDRMLRWDNAAVNPKREKAIATRRAAIRGRAKQAINPGERPHPMFARNALQIHVAAQSAMHVPNVADGSRPSIKARIAGSATPRAQLGQPHQVVLHAMPAGTAGTVALTDRTQQDFLLP